MISASCHCGAVKIEIDAEAPKQLTSCNCSICRRLGTLWAYYHPNQVKIIPAGGTIRYVWGDKTLAFHHCKTCGCTTHWESIDPAQQERMGVNARLTDPSIIANACVRRFDGAKTWTFLD